MSWTWNLTPAEWRDARTAFFAGSHCYAELETRLYSAALATAQLRDVEIQWRTLERAAKDASLKELHRELRDESKGLGR
jgi:hypothetical protein